MTQLKTAVATAVSPRETVLSFVEALNGLDFRTAREYIHDHMYFIGVLGTRNGANEYLQDMKKMRLKYAVQKVFADGDDICLMYDLTIEGKIISGCGWYHVDDGKISWLKVLFDARSLVK